MRSFSRQSRIAASALSALLVAVVSGCSAMLPGGESGAVSQRPEPTEVVTEYLTAIAEGDAATAHALDAAAIEEELGDSVLGRFGDRDMLRSDEVLQGAVERIDDVVVKRAIPIDDDVDVQLVLYAYSLDGEVFENSLRVRWDEESADWELEESLTLYMSVIAAVNSVRQEMPPFRMGGVEQTFAADAETAPFVYIAYPGVYRVTAAFPPEFLVDPDDTVKTVVATWRSNVSVEFEVVALPSE